MFGFAYSLCVGSSHPNMFGLANRLTVASLQDLFASLKSIGSPPIRSPQAASRTEAILFFHR
jgi:hypothetical protein